MHVHLVALAFAAVAGLYGSAPAMAQQPSCVVWTFDLEQDEGGKVWRANICSKSDKGESHLSLSCLGGQYNLRYIPMVEGEFENQRRNFVFSDGGRQESLRLAYEAMDGAFAGNIARSHKLVELFRKGAELTVTDPGRKVAQKQFTLKGADKALAALAGKCRAR